MDDVRRIAPALRPSGGAVSLVAATLVCLFGVVLCPYRFLAAAQQTLFIA